MDNLSTTIQAHLGGFITGAIVAVLQVINEISWIAEQMSDLALDKHAIEDLNKTARYTRLRELSKEEQTAPHDRTRIGESIVQLRALVETIERKGVCLATTAEVD